MGTIEDEGAGVDRHAQPAAPGSLSRSIDLRSGKPAESGDAIRDYGIGAQILAELGVHDMVLLTNTRHSPVGLAGYGLAIVGERPIELGEMKRCRRFCWSRRASTRFNDLLLEGARAAIEAAGHKHETLTVTGALESPAPLLLRPEADAFAPSSRSAW